MKIKLYNDAVFKWIFGRQEHTAPLLNFLNSVMAYDGKELRFNKVMILNPYDTTEPYTKEKQGILDLRVQEVNTLEWIDLEVQVIMYSDYAARAKYYLAGLYREQLKKNQNRNYDELKPCYGIHVLVETYFKEGENKDYWFNHYAMLNTRTYKSLLNHWNLYFIELDKFNEQSKSKEGDYTELERWNRYLGNIQESTEKLENIFKDNEGIKEVHEMIQVFSEDAVQREKYRLYEEFQRTQRGETSRRKKVELILLQTQIDMEKERKAKEEERKAKGEERKAKEEALRKMKEMEEKFILSLKTMGKSDKEIEQWLSGDVKSMLQ